MGWMRALWALTGAWLLLGVATVSAQSGPSGGDGVAAAVAEPANARDESAPAGDSQGALVPAEAPAPEARPATPEGQSEVRERFVHALAFFTVAGVGAVTFAVAGGLALKEDNALAESCGRDAGRTCTDDDVSGLRRRSMVADVGLGLLAVGSVVGVTLWWMDRRESSRRAAMLRPMARVDRHGGSLALGGRF